MAELVTRSDLTTAIDGVKSEIEHTKQQLKSKIDTLGLRLTVRLGVMLAAAVAALAALERVIAS